MTYVLLLSASFLAALVSGAAGFGGSLLLLPVVTACVGPEISVPVLTAAQLLGNLARISTGIRQIEWKSVALFSCASLPLAALGAFGFSLLPKEIVTRCIGAALIILVAAKLLAKKELPKSPATLILGGALTGGLSGLCGSGGPIGAAVFLSLDLAPTAYIASEAATATLMHILKICIYRKLTGLDADALALGLGMGIAMIAGTYAAKHIIGRIPKGKFRVYTAGLLFLVGLYMAITGVN